MPEDKPQSFKKEYLAACMGQSAIITNPCLLDRIQETTHLRLEELEPEAPLESSSGKEK